MLLELRVSGLGVIEKASLVFKPGLIALTGETGVGKTLLIEAMNLLIGGRADPRLVRSGFDEAVVEGRFLINEEEVVLRRLVPRDGRSRAYVRGRLATASELNEEASQLVELHGQHAHQQLLKPYAQRLALDHFANVDVAPLLEANSDLEAVRTELANLGGDERSRAREIDLLRYQVDELNAAELENPMEDELLAAEQAVLADAEACREAAFEVLRLLDSDSPASNALATALSVVKDRKSLTEVMTRLSGLISEFSELASDVRTIVDGAVADPVRLEELGQRRHLFASLRRKYGQDLEAVIAYHKEAVERLLILQGYEARATELESQMLRNEVIRNEAASRVADERRNAAPALAKQIQDQLRQLAMPKAQVSISVDGSSGEKVDILLGANSGSPLLPLTQVASGGELSRTMLALRLVLSDSPPTLVFDEVDSGVGGVTANAVSSALEEVALERQVLVVTHLAQVAASATQHMTVEKNDNGKTVVAEVRELDHEERVLELSRMLSGSPNSSKAREHALELLK